MQNHISNAWKPLCAQAEQAADGLSALGAALGVKQNTEAVIRAALAGAVAANNPYQASKAATAAAVLVEEEMDEEGRGLLRTARDAFKKTLGTVYSRAWDAVGFDNDSLALPRTIAARSTLLASMAAYLTANPGMEVPSLNVTAVAIGAQHSDVEGALSALNAAEADQGAKRVARDAAVAVLRNRLRGLVQELGKLMGPLDPRWLQFGFNEPGRDVTPGVVTGLVVTPGAAHHLQLGWDYTPGSEHFRLYRKIVGVDPDFCYVKTVSDTSATLNSFVSGQHVLVCVAATNSAGEGLRCEPVEAVAP